MWFRTKNVNIPPSDSISEVCASSIDDEEIPRYPPFMRGLPAASVPRVVGTQTELIDQLRQTLGLERDTFDSLIIPVLKRYVAFVHLLPASEAHHHRGAGGLLRHGLEVAFFAARASEGIVFVPFGTPRERHELEPRWHVAVALAGLLHDLGKSVADVSVSDRGGKTEWQPYLQTLLEWAAEYNVERYFLRWNERRHKQHEMYNKMVADRVLTPGIIQWLCQPQPEIARALFETITAANTDSNIYRLVADADRKSVESDLRANHIPFGASLGVPVEKHVLDAMRWLVTNGSWVANQQGGRVWVLRDGVYVVWKHAAKEIVCFLEHDHIPGIPRNPDTLADILIERRLAVPRVLPDGTTYRYWPVSPSALHAGDKPIVLYMLKLAAPQILFDVAPPAVDALVGDQTEIRGAQTRSVIAEALNCHERPMPSEDKRPRETVEVDSEFSSDAAFVPRAEGIGKKVREVATVPARSEQKENLQSNNKISDNEMDDPAAWLRGQGAAGQLLWSMVRDVGEGKTGADEVLVSVGESLILVYPGGASRYGEPGDVLTTLERHGWIAVDSAAPLRKVQEVNGVRGLVLAQEPVLRIRALIGREAKNAESPGVNTPLPRSEVEPRQKLSSPRSKQSRRKSVRKTELDVVQERSRQEQLSLEMCVASDWPSETEAFISATITAITNGKSGVGSIVRTTDGRLRVLRRDIEALAQSAGVKLARLYSRLPSVPECSMDGEYLYVESVRPYE